MCIRDRDAQRLVEEAFLRRTVRNDMPEKTTAEDIRLKAIDYDAVSYTHLATHVLQWRKQREAKS